ncbi:MAG: 6,7-dimethyl-8-ribityllumazine synthase [Candidatus Micrarchaeota archaeon]
MANIGFVIAKFNPEITSLMEEEAVLEAKKRSAKIAAIVHVPGVFEIPFGTQLLLKRKDIDAVVTLGAVIKGATGHDELISHAVAKELLDLSLQEKKPVSLGILGPKISWQQAKARAKPYAKRAAIAAIELCELKRKI